MNGKTYSYVAKLSLLDAKTAMCKYNRNYTFSDTKNFNEKNEK